MINVTIIDEKEEIKFKFDRLIWNILYIIYKGIIN